MCEEYDCDERKKKNGNGKDKSRKVFSRISHDEMMKQEFYLEITFV